MDMNALMSALLSSDSIESISRQAGVSEEETRQVLGSALPQMLTGAQGQAENAETSESFARALSDHARDDASDLRGFISAVDLIDGGKILSHLLGAGQNAITDSAAANTGLKPAQVVKILSIAAPLLMTLLGTQAGKEDNSASGVAGLMSALLGSGDTTELVQTLLFGKKKKKKGLLGLLLGRK